MESSHNCFLCTNLANSSGTGRKNWSRLLCQILHLPHYYENNIEKTKKSHPGLLLLYCDSCTAQLSNVQQMLDELEILEKKIFDAKFLIERQLKNSKEFDECGEDDDEENLIQELRIGLIEELKSASVESMLSRIGGGRVDDRKSDAGGKNSEQIEKANLNVKEQNKLSVSGSQKIVTRIKLNQPKPKSKRGKKRKFKSPTQPAEGTRQSGRRTAKKLNYSVNQYSEDEEGSECIETDPLLLENEPSTDSFGDDEAVSPLGFPNVKIDPGELANLYHEEEPVDIKYSETQEFLTSNEPIVVQPVVPVKPQVKITPISENTRLSRQRRDPSKPPGAKPPCMQSKACDECGKVLGSRTTWLNHVKTFHKNEFKFKCKLCDYGCQWPATLAIHMSVHSQDRPFMCEFCSKCFKLKDRLDKHLRHHNPDRVLRFQCDQCNYKTARSSELKRHAQSHSEVRPFHCNACGKNFKRNFHLTKHKYTVHAAENQSQSLSNTAHSSSQVSSSTLEEVDELLQPSQ